MNLYSALSAYVQHPRKPLIYRAFGGESSNGRLGDSAKKTNEINEAICTASAEKGRIPLSFVQRIAPVRCLP